MQEITRKDKVIMFLFEYYFGLGLYFKIVRLIGGPSIILLGIILYKNELDKFSIAYSGFCLIYGLYYIFKPFLWILFRLDQYKSDFLTLTLDNEKIKIIQETGQSEINFITFQKILERPKYFSLALSKTQKIYLPKKVLTSDQIDILRNKINKIKGNP